MRRVSILLALAIVFSFLLPSLNTQNTAINEAETVLAQEPTGRLAEVLARGRLICGIHGSLRGFGFEDPETGEISGFDVDFCKALTAAVFGEVTEDNLEYVKLTAQARFPAVQNGEVDVLMRNTTVTLTRDTDPEGDFAPVTFYDGQGLMVRADLGIEELADLDGASICSTTGTTTEQNITELFETNDLSYELVVFEETTDTLVGFVDGRCDILTSDKSQLASQRLDTEDPSAYVILPMTISKEPLAPMYLQGDAQWGDIVRWVVYATFYAEELGITSENIDDFMESDDAAVRRFLGLPDEEGATEDLGNKLGLSNDFAANAIRAVGNYGEIYDRNIVPLGIDRAGTLNAQYYDGGLIYAQPWK